MRKIFQRKYILLYIICFLLPIINLVNNNLIYYNYNSIWQKLTSCFVACVILLSLCLVNVFIEESIMPLTIKSKWTVIVIIQSLCDILMSFVYMLLDFNIIANTYRMGRTIPEWVLFFKLLSASAILITIQGTIRTYEEKEKIRVRNAALKNEMLQTKFDVLKHQINIHFLNNSLSTLISLVRLKDPSTEQYIISLSNMYRQLLTKQYAIMVTLAEELDLLRSYIFMMKVCHEDSLQINMDIKDDSLKRQLPTFSLQVLMENCIKHNIISFAKPLSIHIYQKDGNSITVENNFQPKTSLIESTGIGLINLQHRYDLLEIKNGVTIAQNDNAFIVTIKFI